jgi:hypothetical protein
VLPRRWAVEGTFGWLLRYCRLVRDYERCDYERRPDHHEAMVLWATIAIMTRQFARHCSGALPHPPMGPVPPYKISIRTKDQQAA